MLKKWLLSVAALVSLSLVGVASANDKSVVIGATTGPYADQVKYGIKPFLEGRGYKVKLVEFNDYVQPNKALADGSLDANLFQHSIYLENFAKGHELALMPLIHVPTAPMGLYSNKFKSLDDLKDGARIAVPNDPTNLARALLMLEQLGWGKLKESFNPLTASEKDIVPVKTQFKLVPLEAAQLPRSLNDTDFSFVTGNFALSSGMKLTSALRLEEISRQYVNVVAIRTADKDSQLAKDITDAVNSPEFATMIKERFQGFYLPAN